MATDNLYINSGIYRITCEITNKIYIGSAQNIIERWRSHINTLRRNSHHNNHLQNAWNKYGENSFSFDVIEYIFDTNKLIECEQVWLNIYRPFSDEGIGYNICKVAENTKGWIQSKETKEKIRQKAIGRKMPEITRKAIKNAQVGRKNSKETKLKMSEKQRGSKHNMAKLTEYQVIEIKLRILSLEKLKDIAHDYSLNEKYIACIKNGSRWGHILPDLDLTQINLRKAWKNEEYRNEIKEQYKNIKISIYNTYKSMINPLCI